MSSYQYRKSHCGDKTVVRSSYLRNGISYTGKMSSLYWIGALDAFFIRVSWSLVPSIATRCHDPFSTFTIDVYCFLSDPMTSSNGNIFRVTGPLWGEFTGHREFPSQSPVTRTFMFSLICAWINCWVNKRKAGDLRRHRAHYDVIVMRCLQSVTWTPNIILQIRARPRDWWHIWIWINLLWHIFPMLWYIEAMLVKGATSKLMLFKWCCLV